MDALWFLPPDFTMTRSRYALHMEIERGQRFALREHTNPG